MRRRYGLLVICAAIMLATVIAVMTPIVSAGSSSGNFNNITAQDGLQKVLIGQNLEFEGFNAPVAVYRLVSGDISNTYTVDNNRIYNVNWPTTGAFYVNYNTTTEKADAQLSVEAPIIPLEIKVGSATVSGVMVGTTAIRIDTAGINLFDEDVVDLIIIGPAGQISYDAKNVQHFKGINVSKLKDYGATGGLKISDWKVGEYTFQVKTVSGQACGLEDESAVMSLNIGVIPTPTPVTTPDEEVKVTPLRTTPTVTPTPLPTATLTSVPTVMPAPTVSPIPAATPTPTPSTPGFGLMCAVIGLVAVVSLIRRRGLR